MNEIIEKLEMGLMVSVATGTPIVHVEREDAEKIIALLKEQEPRVMTLDELESSQPDPDTDDNIVWIEWHGGCVRVAHIIGIDHLVCAEYISGLDTLIYEHLSALCQYEIHGQELGEIRQMQIGHLHIDSYGKTWRCWTSRPTNEQRGAVKWE